MLKTLFILTTIMASTVSFAETCPSIDEIKTNYFHGWQPLNIESGSQVSPAQLNEFKNTVNGFALAEWMRDAPEGAAHCYYSEKEGAKKYASIFLARSDMTPNKNLEWIQLNKDIFQCLKSISECGFF